MFIMMWMKLGMTNMDGSGSDEGYGWVGACGGGGVHFIKSTKVKFASRSSLMQTFSQSFKCFKDFLFTTAARIYFWIP